MAFDEQSYTDTLLATAPAPETGFDEASYEMSLLTPPQAEIAAAPETGFDDASYEQELLASQGPSAADTFAQQSGFGDEPDKFSPVARLPGELPAESTIQAEARRQAEQVEPGTPRAETLAGIEERSFKREEPLPSPLEDVKRMPLRALEKIGSFGGEKILALTDLGRTVRDNLRRARFGLEAKFAPKYRQRQIAKGLAKDGIDGQITPATTKMERKIEAVVDAEKERFSEDMRVSMQEGGLPAALALQLSESAWKVASNLLVAKQVTGALPGGTTGVGASWKGVVKHAGKFAAYSYATSPGTPEERMEAATKSFLYVATPAISMGVPTDGLAKIVDFALNSGISMAGGVYADAAVEAQEMATGHGKDWAKMSNGQKAKYYALTLPTVALSDLLFSMGTKSARGGKLRDAFISKSRVTKGLLDNFERQFENVPREDIQRAIEEGIQLEGVKGTPAELGIDQPRETPTQAYQRVLAETGSQPAATQARMEAGAARPSDLAAFEPQPREAVQKPAVLKDLAALPEEAGRPLSRKERQRLERTGQVAQQRGVPDAIQEREAAQIPPRQAPAVGKEVGQEVRVEGAAAKEEVRAPRELDSIQRIADKSVSGAKFAGAKKLDNLRDAVSALNKTLPETERVPNKGKYAERKAAFDSKMNEMRTSPTARDIEAEAAARSKGGFIEAPSPSRIKQIGKGISKWAKRKISTTEGLSKDLFSRTRDWRLERSAESVEAWFQKAEFKRAKTTLAKTHGKEVANEGLADVLYGRATTAEFAQKFGLETTDPIVKALDSFNNLRTERAGRIATMLEKLGGSDELIAKLRSDEAYVTRMYEIHMLGKDFVPKPQDYEAAVKEVESGYVDALERLGKRATKIGSRTGMDMQKFLESGDISELQRLSPEEQGKIASLSSAFRDMRGLMERMSFAPGGEVTMHVNAAALRNASQSLIDYHLNRQTRGGDAKGVLDVGNLQRRYLKGAFRALYGEITDPVMAAARTTEVQGKLLANLMFFDRMAREGEGQWWSNRPNSEKGHSVNLGVAGNKSDQYRYGELAGKFVSPEFKEAISGKQVNTALATYYNAKSTMRLLKLYGVRTIGRNYVQALVGFGLGSGDVMRPGYFQNLKKAHQVMIGLSRGDPAAIRKLKEYTKNDAFRAQASSMVDDIERILSTTPKTQVSAALRKMGTWYAYIDFPTKVASYETRLQMGDTKAEAAEHVRKHYQHAQSLPAFVRDLSKLPLSDYPAYMFDSTRILGNQIVTATRQARKGDAIPLLGLIASQSLVALNYTVIAKATGKATRAAVRFIRKEKDDIEDAEDMTKQQKIALREFLPSYYENAPMDGWWETKKDGTKQFVYVITGNQSAFPIEDLLVGAMQASGGSPKDFLKTAGSQVVAERLSPGMFETAIYKLGTGDEMPWPGQETRFKSKGIADLGVADPEAQEIIMRSALNLGLDIGLGQYGSKLQQLKAIEERKEAGQKPKAGTYSPRVSTGDVLLSAIEPVRTYRVDKERFTAMMRRRILAQKESLMTAKGIISREAAAVRKYGASTEKQQEKAVDMQGWRIRKLHEFEGVVANARQFAGDWVNDVEMTAILRDGGLSMGEAQAVIFGKVDELVEYAPRSKKSQLERIMDGDVGTTSRTRRRQRRQR